MFDISSLTIGLHSFVNLIFDIYCRSQSSLKYWFALIAIPFNVITMYVNHLDVIVFISPLYFECLIHIVFFPFLYSCWVLKAFSFKPLRIMMVRFYPMMMALCFLSILTAAKVLTSHSGFFNWTLKTYRQLHSHMLVKGEKGQDWNGAVWKTHHVIKLRLQILDRPTLLIKCV